MQPDLEWWRAAALLALLAYGVSVHWILRWLAQARGWSEQHHQRYYGRWLVYPLLLGVVAIVVGLWGTSWYFEIDTVE
jgi:hypothetical protein